MRSGANRRPYVSYGHKQNDIHACAMTPYKILEFWKQWICQWSLCAASQTTLFTILLLHDVM